MDLKVISLMSSESMTSNLSEEGWMIGISFIDYRRKRALYKYTKIFQIFKLSAIIIFNFFFFTK